MKVKKSHLFFLGVSVISLQFCQLPNTSVELNSEQNISNQNREEQINLPIIITPLLPKLNQDDLSNLKNILDKRAQSWFDLAGLNKISAPPKFSPELQSYREAWFNVNPRIATFLGLWYSDEDPRYYLSIFPAVERGKMCILEFRPEWSITLTTVNEETGEHYIDMISEQILSFSVGEEKSGQVQSSQISTSQEVIITENFSSDGNYPVELIAVLDEENHSNVLASYSPPILPPDLPDSMKEKVNQTLSNYGCITGINPP